MPKRFEELPDVVTPKDASAFLGVHVKTVYTYIKEGRLRAARFGKTYRIKKSWILDLLDNQSELQ